MLEIWPSHQPSSLVVNGVSVWLFVSEWPEIKEQSPITLFIAKYSEYNKLIYISLFYQLFCVVSQMLTLSTYLLFEWSLNNLKSTGLEYRGRDSNLFLYANRRWNCISNTNAFLLVLYETLPYENLWKFFLLTYFLG